MTTAQITRPEWNVAAKGQAPLACRHCRTIITSAQMERTGGCTSVTCLKCGKSVSTISGALSIRNDCAVFLDTQTVRETIWYHATDMEDWTEALEDARLNPDEFFLEDYPEGGDPSVMVHVGTLDAALDRAVDMYAQSGETVYVYEVRLRDGVEIADTIRDDDNDDCPGYAQNCPEAGYSTQVTRYVNRYESTGSISLLVNSTAFEVVKVTVI